MLELPPKGKLLLIALLEDIDANPRYRGGFTMDAEGGAAHAWGAVDTERYGSGSYCGTKKDVKRLAACLRQVGVDLSFDEADALLSEALWRHGAGELPDSWYSVSVMGRPKQWDDEAARQRAKRHARVLRLRAEGICTNCGTVPVYDGRTTCRECGRKANAYRSRKRAAARAVATIQDEAS